MARSYFWLILAIIFIVVPLAHSEEVSIFGNGKGTIFSSGTVSISDNATVGCNDTTIAVPNATTSMTCAVAPQGSPIGTGSANLTWSCYLTTGNLVIRTCTLVLLTSAATTYNYVVFN